MTDAKTTREPGLTRRTGAWSGSVRREGPKGANVVNLSTAGTMFL